MRHSIRGSFAAAVFTGLSLAAGPAAAGGMMVRGMMDGGMMDGGMMDGGMMDGGMMGQGANGSRSQSEESSDPAIRNLLGYVRSNGLTCLSCHSVGSRSVGPTFMDIARRYAGNDGAQSALAESIANGAAGKWAGYPAMPSGLASPSQATKLSALILSLAPHSDH